MNELPMYCFAAFLHEENFSPGNYFDNVGDSFHAMRNLLPCLRYPFGNPDTEIIY